MADKKADKKDDKKKDDGHGDAAAAPKKSKKKLFIIVGALVVLGAGAGVPLFLMGGETPEGEEHAHEQHEVTHLEVVPMEVFVVNLSQHTAFIKTKLLLEYDHDIVHKHEEALAKAGHGLPAEGGGGHGGGAEGLSGYLKHREPMLRDAIIRVLSSKRPEEVLTVDGKERLKEELLETINEAIALDESPVQNIYFAEFIIQ